MSYIDWIIVTIYIMILLGMSYIIGRRQKNQEDYYLGGRALHPMLVSSSLMANQVSAISLIGAPAFIAIKSDGGLKWLQYEMAIPLAMIFIIIFLAPIYWKAGGITIYEYLEKRFGILSRSLLSLIFLISRSLGTGVALLATSYVTSVCVDIGLTETILSIGAISFIYTSLGGMKADIYSDAIQLVILWLSSFVCIFILFNLLGGEISFTSLEQQRLRIFDFASSGIGDGNTFAFWPMLFGGFFLYVSYYGCDQSQAQRLLSTSDCKKAKTALLWNGLLRFPLVLTYCVIGILIIPLLAKRPDFLAQLDGKPPDYLMPYFFKEFMPVGLLGVIISGIFAASMSSLDSAINSLSAATWEDFLGKLIPKLSTIPDKKKVLYSRLITIFWGILTTAFALKMAGGSETVIELVNKIGSAFYGPVAGVFALGIFIKRADQKSAVAGLFLGVSSNIVLWLFFTDISWMWWNLTGFAIALFCGILLSFWSEKTPEDIARIKISKYFKDMPVKNITVLCVWFFFLIAFSFFLENLLK